METTEANSPKRIVVTRPQQQAATWIARIHAVGHQTLVLPTLEITPLGEHNQSIKQEILKLDEYAILIFVSQNAVNYGFQWIEDYWPQLPEKIYWLAIGAKTQQVLSEKLTPFGLTLPTSQSDTMTSEELLESATLKDVKGKKILIMRGVGGRTHLGDVLIQRGASLRHCELYERGLPDNAHELMGETPLHPERDILTFFSGETLSNFYSLLMKQSIKQWQTFNVIVPSARVHDLAKDYGFERVISAKNASEDAMWQALLPLLSEN